MRRNEPHEEHGVWMAALAAASGRHARSFCAGAWLSSSLNYSLDFLQEIITPHK